MYSPVLVTVKGLVLLIISAARAIPAGVGAHSLKSLEASINACVKSDFYLKTFHHDKY